MRYLLGALPILAAFAVFLVLPALALAPPAWLTAAWNGIAHPRWAQPLRDRLARARLRRLAATHRGLVAQALAGCLDGHPVDDVARVMHPTRPIDVFLCERCETIFEEKPRG